MSIHPSAFVDPKAELGYDVEIGPGAFVGPNVVMGDGCRIHHRATVEGNTHLGDGCQVFPGAILGMPLTFDAKAAGDATATIQFRVSGADGGDFWLRVADGACQSFEGRAPSAELTINTPSSVWLGIARGELDGAQALLDRQYAIEGDSAILLRFGEWFPSRR